MPRPPQTARDALVAVLVAAAVGVLAAGDSVGRAAEEMEPGLVRDAVELAGGPTGWIADHTPVADAWDQVSGWLTGEDDAAPEEEDPAVPGGAVSGAEGVVPAGAFDPRELGEPVTPRPLRTLLVTGDSLAQPLDAQLARSLAGDGVKTVREPRLGTGISKTFLLDWRELAVEQARRDLPDATVVFLGANEGFPFPRETGGEISCCGPDWAAAHATRARKIMRTYLRGGRGRVIWILVPMPRDRDRQEVARAVNAALRVAAAPFGAQVDILDAAAVFTPAGRYRDTMPVQGREQLVRKADGIHLTDRGTEVLRDLVLRRLRSAFAVSP